MFFGGFAFLPLLWAVTYVHYRRAAASPQASHALKAYVRYSAVGAATSFVLLGGWILTVQLTWQNWGAAGRALLLFVPTIDDEGTEL